MDELEERRGRVCAEHTLATGPDGRCVLCRREQGRVAARRVGVGFAVLAAVTTLGLGAVVVRRSWPAEAAPVAVVSAASIAPEPAPEERTAVAATTTARTAAATTGAERRGVAAAPAASANEEAETRARHQAIEARAREEALEAARRRVQITVYTTPWCPHCAHARKWLSASNISFQEVDIERSESGKRRLREINPRGSIPTFDIEGETLVGFSESSVAAARERAALKLARL